MIVRQTHHTIPEVSVGLDIGEYEKVREIASDQKTKIYLSKKYVLCGLYSVYEL